MDPSLLKSESDAPRKRRFVPKAPPRRVPKPEIKPEAVEDIDGAHARDLLKRFNEGLARSKPKAEKKVAQSQVAFGYSGLSSSIRSFGGARKSGSNSSHQGSPSTGYGETLPSGTLEEKEYIEPWDYYTYYPTTLPLRRPYSGNPELLEEEESQADQNKNLDKSAIDLGLMEENPEASMFFLQLPPILPLTKRSTTTDAQEVPEVAQAKQKPCAVNELPGGLMGKMLVYRSGAIKLRLGDTLYNVSSGLPSSFSQDVVAVNNAEKQCCIVGEPNKRAIITPDLDSIFASVEDL